MTEQATGPTGHSLFGMSVLERRIACPGSAHAERNLADTSSEAADYGIKLHDIAARALISGVDAVDMIEDDDTGAEIVQAYLDEVRALHRELGGQLLVEQRFHLANIADELWGTADAVILAPPCIAVADLKTGFGRVRARRDDGRPNLQLAGYCLGAMEVVPRGEVITSITLSVVQPRNGGTTRIDVDPLEMIELAADLSDAVAQGCAPDAARSAGGHCKYCKAAAGCAVLRAFTFEVAHLEFDDLGDGAVASTPSPEEMGPDEIARALHSAETIEIWLKAVREFAHVQAKLGAPPTGWKLVERAGRTIWRDNARDEVIELVRRYNGTDEDVFSEPKLRTPKQVLASLKKRKAVPDATEIAALTTSAASTALVPASDPRPAISSGAAADFDDQP